MMLKDVGKNLDDVEKLSEKEEENQISPVEHEKNQNVEREYSFKAKSSTSYNQSFVNQFYPRR